MKKCNHCRLMIGGSAEECPVCQSLLEGEPEDNIWPAAEKLKIQSMIYRLHLFIFISIVIVCSSLELILKIAPIKNWSFIVIAILCMLELFIQRLLAKPITPTGCISMLAFLSIISLAILGEIFDFMGIVINTCTPALLMAIFIPGFFLCLADRSENSLVYVLTAIALSVFPVIYMLIYNIKVSIPWFLAFCLGLICFVGLIIFLGRKTLWEIQKRLYM